MCFKVGQQIKVDYIVLRELGHGAILSIEGNPGNSAILFPDKQILHCDLEKNVWYYETQGFLFIYGNKILLDAGYEQESNKERKLKVQGRGFSIFVKLLHQTPEQKKSGIFQVNLVNMTI